MFWTAIYICFQSIESIVSGSLILFNCHLAWAQVCQQHHLSRSLASYFLLFFSYLSSINDNDRLFSFLSGTSTCTHLVTNTAPIHFPSSYTCMIWTRSLLRLGWWLNWLSSSWTRSMRNTTQLQVQLHNIYRHYRKHWVVTTFVWIWPYFATNAGRFVFAVAAKNGWGWSNFIPLKTLMDPLRCYIVGSNCMLKADVTIIGSSNDG